MTTAALLRGRGWKPDTSDFIQKTARFGLPHIGFGAPLLVPKSVDLLTEHARFLDQINSDGCVGFGFVGSIETRLRFLGYNPVPFSPQGVWTMPRQMSRVSAFEPLRNEGTHPYLASYCIRTFGIPTEDEFPFDPNDLTKEIDFDTLGRASSFRLDGFSRIAERDDQLVEMIKQLLAAGHPVPYGSYVGRKYMDWKTGQDPVGVEDGDPVGGGHFIYLTGYEDDGNVFRSVGSYGKGHGDNGTVLIAREKIVAASSSDFYNMTIVEK